ncbi:MAG: ABC transporter ATP-binding protein [Rhizobiaceae bacterium]|nr:ABC transporter ATP-binding protein [Rhizobiaceae bacterium]MCV0408580.1 ABC transporter ATP-binding protein [Rhizobiaceae bacterium]
MARLILDAITRRFGADQPAVDAVSLDIAPGTFLALLGPSGCGKTTTLRLVAGFETPDSGRILLGDRLLAEGARAVPPEDRNMAMVFQSHALWPHMSVAENVGYPLKVRGLPSAERAARIAHALDTVDLGGFRDRAPAELSGGQRQRVALARCLVTDPDVILFDEPLASLDRHLKASLEDAFRAFHRRTGATIVYVTHDQAEAMALADTVAVMDRGRIAQAGAPESIYRHPQTRAVAALIGQGAILDLPCRFDSSSREIGRDALHAAFLAPAASAGSTVPVLVRPEDVVADPAEGIEFTVSDCVFRGERYGLALVHASDRRVFAWSAVAATIGETVRYSLVRGRLLEG